MEGKLISQSSAGSSKPNIAAPPSPQPHFGVFHERHRLFRLVSFKPWPPKACLIELALEKRNQGIGKRKWNTLLPVRKEET